VTRVHWVQVAEGKQPIILVDHASIRSAGNDAAEYTVHASSFAHHRRPSTETSGLLIFSVHEQVSISDLGDCRRIESRCV
jgi:hypothetical protein